MDSPRSVSSQTPLLADPSNQQTATANHPANGQTLYGSSQSLPTNQTATPKVSSAVTRRLYISHFLSTWNSRLFEFGAVLYLASIFPRTLLPMSVYALARGLSAIVLSPVVGHYIDVGNRLQVVRLSIVLQRIAAAASCVAFWFLTIRWPLAQGVKTGLLVLLIVLACIEKLCSIMNLVSVEKDWVVVIAADNEPALRTLNSQMRRIDLFCKLVGPFVIALIDGISTEIAIIINFSMNVASIIVEYYAIAKVYKMVPNLQRSERSSMDDAPLSQDTGSFSYAWQRLREGVLTGLRGLSFYFQHPAFLPSFAIALLNLTVLSFGGQMVTYLLSVGYNSVHIGIARTVSVAFEISATWIAPIVMSRIGSIRAGIWFITWQILCLVAGAGMFWGAKDPLISASGLVGGTILSRVGLWGFDLSAQIIIQEEVEPSHRGSFSSLEASWQNAFELCSYVTTIVFSRPEQFQWPVLVSCMAVFTAGSLYTAFVKFRRGHLIHLPKRFDMKNRTATPSDPSYDGMPA